MKVRVLLMLVLTIVLLSSGCTDKSSNSTENGSVEKIRMLISSPEMSFVEQ